MKVAIVLNTSWNIYNFRMGLVKALINSGIEVYAIAPHDEYSKLLQEAGCHFVPVRMDSRGANPLKDSALIIELWAIYRKIKPDIILHYTIKPNIYGTIAASLLRIPVINNVCGLGTVFMKDNLVSKIAIALYKISFRFPRKIFFQNEDDLKFFVKKKIVKESISDLIPGSGIDPNYFAATAFSKNQKFTFLMISRLIHDKGILEYIEAIKLLRNQGMDARFQLMGAKDILHRRGIPEEIINTWISENVVEYLGTTHDVRPIIAKADCVVLPSYREGTPRTLLEAASSGKPIVATNVAGCNNVVMDNHNGFLCELKNAQDLAEKMKKMADLPARELKILGANGRKLIEQKFNEQIVIDKYLESIHTFKQ